MRLIYILSAFFLFSCATSKQSNPNMKKWSVDVEVIVNNMPTTDVGSKNYAIVTFDAGGDTLQENWKLTEFILKDQHKEVIQKITDQELNDEFSGKGTTQRKINVRNLPHSIQGSVIVSVLLVSDKKSEFYHETDPIQPMIVE